ncbi:cytochrome P450 monooxygenase pc-bph [Cantharellus anzutake]|uniref:cytochrome P450 monooxygenase pc-bph n=1 Tax=Cantharellus anzutake TaxID=1750568 RepID=UPI00190421B9|nr:cytochrome P450 monooxygenase pc-bph [Cantharellus anzutake]XP_038910249.1 cytochrome P450 monooxygenase pc-bph [Cantharellus anzutake]KAF8319191.1 cytochrome P450 monooxygenase pc-bph [Cantharellus anzutake]KAF8320170.1 cytochrome P450 monooxygenase pc-bph [Cantharellus anzutake]
MQKGNIVGIALGSALITALRPSGLLALILTILHSPLYILLSTLFGIIAFHVIEYLNDPYGYNTSSPTPIPGPWIAKLSDIWLSRKAALGDRSGRIHKLHQKYGKVVRIAPNHISIADPEALQIVYAHGNGSLKSDFYDAFVSLHRGLFNTRDRAEHTRKRKIVSSIFSQKNVLEFEPYIQNLIALMMVKWDSMTGEAEACKDHEQVKQEFDLNQGGIGNGKSGEGKKVVPLKEGTYAEGGRVWFDALKWFNYLAFDIIGDLAFGSPFGMLQAEKDEAAVLMPGDTPDKTVYLPAIQILNDRGNYSASLGVIPPVFRPIVKQFPWFKRGTQAVKSLAGIAVAAVGKRLSEPSDRNDLLSKLQKGKDVNGNPMGRAELTAEAQTQLIAGSDTTSNSSCAITYFLATHPEAQKKLQAELDEALGHPICPNVGLEATVSELKSDVAPYDAIKALPYLQACIQEGLRMHSTSGIGLPRIVPAGGLTVMGRFYKEGSILSVPSYSIHRDRDVWGEDVDEYRPERWFEGDEEKMQKTFNPFSWGPRACVGKNLAMMELLMIIASVFRRYEFVPVEEDQKMETLEGFLRKPLECVLGVKRRDI